MSWNQHRTRSSGGLLTCPDHTARRQGVGVTFQTVLTTGVVFSPGNVRPMRKEEEEMRWDDPTDP